VPLLDTVVDLKFLSSEEYMLDISIGSAYESK
jgi:hypothetical protein